MRTLFAFLAVLALALVSISPATALTYIGSLSTPDGIQATGDWYGNFSIGWEITQMNNGSYDYWHYEYTFNYPRKDISHMIMEISPNATMRDFFNISGFSDDSPTTYYPTEGKPNPGMPGPLYGFKFEGGTDGPMFYSFDSFKIPTWGDFFTVSGTDNQDGFVYAYNTDFSMPDPLAPAQNGLLPDGNGGYIYKILRPDTVSTIPEPSTLLLLGSALFAGGLIRRFRK